MAEHTHWIVGQPTPCGTLNPDSVYESDGTTVCRVPGIPISWTLEEVRADPRFTDLLNRVHLLSAAPSLLAACKAAQRTLEAMTTASPIRAAQLDSAICEIEAAISLAEGES